MEKEKKKSFVLYYSFRKHLEILTNEECGKLFKALMDYGEKGQEPDLEGAALMAFSFIACQMDRDAEEYEKKCKKRSESGKKGGRPKKITGSEDEQNESNENQTKAKKANGFSEKQSKAKKADNDNEYDNDNDNEYDNDILKPPIVPPEETPVQKASLQEQRFSSFWKEYPKKVGKQAALKAWEKIRPDAELYESIMQAIATAKESQEWTKENGQYIPHPATWLNQGRWDDELTPAKAEPERRAPNYGSNSGRTERKETGTESTAKKTLSGFHMAE